MTDVPASDRDDRAPSTALVERVLTSAAEVLIIEASVDELDRTDAARIVVSGTEIIELAQLLAVVDGGTGSRCLCLGWPTILVFDAAGREIARWTLHHQMRMRGLGDCDAQLRDGPGLTDWLSDHGLTGSRTVQQELAKEVAETEERRVRWVRAAPPALAKAAEAASHRVPGAEEQLARLVAQRYPDAVERVLALAAWAGFPPRHTTTFGGTPWYELAPERMLLAESTELIFEALGSTKLTPDQLDGAAELFTSLEWTRPLRADVPEPLRSLLIAHVAATGTDPMRFRMRHGYGATSIVSAPHTLA